MIMVMTMKKVMVMISLIESEYAMNMRKCGTHNDETISYKSINNKETNSPGCHL